MRNTATVNAAVARRHVCDKALVSVPRCCVIRNFKRLGRLRIYFARCAEVPTGSRLTWRALRGNRVASVSLLPYRPRGGGGGAGGGEEEFQTRRGAYILVPRLIICLYDKCQGRQSWVMLKVRRA